ncbi:hypothetical protein HDV57DRAFT_491283 [Trichoderma longibrachiatum]|uniref:Uncharacterized protein n=1 Tax=Trichoderma longibrachiatum ATCC 18648 TaxID=983965 RepID=A0A2T4C1P2_TRILO|nr:hypothetical protein M440DRAFT_1402025 [Trichoderma longibrachiatum ATCC 18648]
MQLRILLAVFIGVASAATLQATDCDCFVACDSDLHDPGNCYNNFPGCTDTCCGLCGCNCP